MQFRCCPSGAAIWRLTSFGLPWVLEFDTVVAPDRALGKAEHPDFSFLADAEEKLRAVPRSLGASFPDYLYVSFHERFARSEAQPTRFRGLRCAKMAMLAQSYLRDRDRAGISRAVGLFKIGHSRPLAARRRSRSMR